MEECDVRLARILLEVTAHVRDHLGHRLLVAACLAAGDDLALFEGEDGLDVQQTAHEGAGPANAAALLQELEGRDREEGEARLADALELLHGLLCGLALVAQPYGNLDHVPQANTGGTAVENRDRHIDGVGGDRGDRKSTRLNSSHVAISYAVFCLKKKMTPRSAMPTR